MTLDTLAPEALPTDSDTPHRSAQSLEDTSPRRSEASDGEVSAPEKPKKSPGKKAKTVNLTLTVTGTADGDWRAELKQGSTYLARDLAVAAAAVSRAAKELHEELSTPIDKIIEEARSQQAAKVAALESELEAARKVLADLD